ncbi:MAG: Gfo/Idh/MocA family oxidoreductase [Planctomycetes bacterium]|nr:Gfo/Idh/MocA family oxidoreductase [Planctomycetota bacterium]MCP4772176.1 Gfo/Idh/MocA family oxidoreductase [Planctomycetota bacterium]MCP4861232.1 Gfo/Idh/MocA family oxidoreductase [Planctomycetota bacterium]
MDDMDRRHFIKSSTSASLAALMVGRGFAQTTLGPLFEGDAAAGNAAGNAELRIGLIGCGGRGTGAAAQALSTEGGVRLVAMADAFSDRLESSLKTLQNYHPDAVDVPAERRFVGFDGYQKVIASDIDVLVIATPPGFRPIHFEAGINAGKHVFMEKPLAVDGPGVRKILAAAQVAKQKQLKVGVGLQRHHQKPYMECVQRLHDGEIGRITLLRTYWNSGGVWVRPREEGQTEMEYQMRNWYYFNWLCGDHIVEQHIHNLDVGNWIMKGYPTKAQGQGGRQVRTGLEHGEIFDHHMVEFSYEDGTRMLSQCRHQPGCWSPVEEHAHGTEGTADVSRARIQRYDNDTMWRFRGDYKDAYQVEHDDLFAAIRNGTPYNEAEYGAMSTMTAILGRMATYCGKEVSMADALASELALVPSAYLFDGIPPTVPNDAGRYPIPIPGVTKSY